MNKIVILLILTIAFVTLFVNCKKETSETTTPVTTTPITEDTKTVTAKKECYAYDAKGSKIELQLQYNTDNITGTLNYALSEKDKNTGTIKGKIENNILLVAYTFQSEGMESTRQVAFQLLDDKLVEGYGEMNKDGTHFKDVSKLKFTSTMPLSKVDCP